MRIIIIILIFQVLTFCTAQTGMHSSNSNSETPNDTILLKNNYRLIYSVDNKFRNLRLMGATVDTILISNSINLPESNLGWLEADLDSYIVIYSSGGNGVHNMNLFNKQTGIEIARGIGIDIDTISNIIYYEDLKNQNKLSLLDLNNMKIEVFDPPKEIPCAQWWNCIKIIGISNEELTIEYEQTGESKATKKYVR